MERQIIRYQGELWSEIPGHHGKYFASRNGQILSLAKSQSKPRVLRQIRDGEYLHVFLYDGTREKLRVHRAVLLPSVPVLLRQIDGESLQRLRLCGRRRDRRECGVPEGTADCYPRAGTPLYCCQSKKACLDFDERGERPIRYQEV